MTRAFQLISVTHKTTSLRNVARFVVPQQSNEELVQRLEALKVFAGAKEIYYLSTCNRVLIGFYRTQVFTSDELLLCLQNINPDLKVADLEFVNFTVGKEAVVHLHEVAASLDSLVVGEREILRQVREAYAFCLENNLCGDNWRMLMQSVVAAAKDVYTRSSIGEKPVSIVGLACEQLHAWGLPKNARILLIGAGQSNTTIAKFLAKHCYNNITVLNRTLEKAETLARIVKGNALPLTALPTLQQGFDGLIVCTGATTPIITNEVFESIVVGEVSKKYILDLSIPHNVAESVSQLPNVQYLSVELLELGVQENLGYRMESVGQAQDILQEHLAGFESILRQRSVEIKMSDLPLKVKALRKNATEKVFRKELEALDPATRNLVEDMLTYMEKQYVSLPMRAAIEAVK